jgi:hypothetical protein
LHRALCESAASRHGLGGFSILLGWAFRPRNPMKNRAFVGQPILAAAVFQAAFSILRASLAEGTADGFSTLSPTDARVAAPPEFAAL